MKLLCLDDITDCLNEIHQSGLVHCNLHYGNIGFKTNAFHSSTAFICDFGLSKSQSSGQKSTIQGVMPFVAPEVFSTRQYTLKSDIYAFGIIMHLVANGEPPFRHRLFDNDLVCDIMGGLRPTMPDSVPEAYRKLAELCCDANTDKRPTSDGLSNDINELIQGIGHGNNTIWNTIYQTDVKPLSCPEQEKYSHSFNISNYTV